MRHRSILCLLAWFLFVPGQSVCAQGFVNVFDIPPDPNLGNGLSLFATQINLSDGGEIGAGISIALDSEVNVDGGTVGAGLTALTGVNISVSHGTIGAGLTASDGLVEISGGTFGSVSLNDAEANISGGHFGSLNVENDDANTFSANGGTFDISGGAFGMLRANGSTLDVSGGTFDLLEATASSLNMTDGFASLLYVNSGTMNISGGSFGNLFGFDSTIELSGTQFVLDGKDITASLNLNEATIIDDRDVTLSGRLADGSAFSINLNTELGEDVIDTATELRVLRIGGLLGDYNLNGTVDAPDYNIWRNTFSSDTELAADGNDNGVVDAPDYNIWRNGFGTTLGAAVPEPSTTVLVLWAPFWLAVLCRCQRRLQATAIAAAILLATSFTTSPASAARLLPDLHPLADEELGYLFDGAIDRDTLPGRDLYRFTSAIANQGVGPFEVIEVTDANFTQRVWQRIHDDDGSVHSSLMGTFTNANPDFGHLYLDSLARYNLREVLADEGVGPVIASNDKTSFALLDSVSFDESLPGAPESRVYKSQFDTILGVSVGWLDRYGRNLPDQWIDVTGLSGGEYWLEVIIDPLNYVQELDDNNNLARVIIELDLPILSDLSGDYNLNGAVDTPDYLVWRDSFGSTTELDADGNDNGVIDAPDYNIWRNNFGNTAGAAVPEPTSAALFALAAIGLLIRVRPC